MAPDPPGSGGAPSQKPPALAQLHAVLARDLANPPPAGWDSALVPAMAAAVAAGVSRQEICHHLKSWDVAPDRLPPPLCAALSYYPPNVSPLPT